ncbi:Alpha/Beta hydrolase protein [Geopyxis carbonaria]|nr:Alpha/Beta hydrolase protein [Geopyxis carbonaria]
MPATSHNPASLSVFEKITLGFKLFHVLVTTKVTNLITYPTSPNATYSHHAQRRTLHALLSLLTPRQMSALSPTSEATFLKLHPTGVITEYNSPGCPTARVFWPKGVPTKDSKVLLFLHGGGFQLPLAPGHLKFLTYAAPAGTAVGALEYLLTPEPGSQYPASVRSAVVALQGLLDASIPAENITIAGDSAGAHMSLSLLGHLLHPHPDLPRLDLRGARLAGIVLISPCVTTSTASGSMKRCTGDVIWNGQLDRWLRMFISPAHTEDGHWAEALPAPPSWWHGTHAVTKAVLCTAGDAEVFYDDIVTWWEVFNGAVKGEEGLWTELCVGQGETHDTPLLDFEVDRVPSEVSKQCKQWFAKLAEKE